MARVAFNRLITQRYQRRFPLHGDRDRLRFSDSLLHPFHSAARPVLRTIPQIDNQAFGRFLPIPGILVRRVILSSATHCTSLDGTHMGQNRNASFGPPVNLDEQPEKIPVRRRINPNRGAHLHARPGAIQINFPPMTAGQAAPLTALDSSSHAVDPTTTTGQVLKQYTLKASNHIVILILIVHARTPLLNRHGSRPEANRRWLGIRPERQPASAQTGIELQQRSNHVLHLASSAPPLAHYSLFNFFAEYSDTGKPAWDSLPGIATPRAWPSLSAESAFRAIKTCSIADSSGL